LLLFVFGSIHVVFGHIISGQAVVKQIEGLPVDRRSRPLQDAKVVNCGELVPKAKPKGISLQRSLNLFKLLKSIL
jgi:cyclophilin family peptidyl-prolyl cis-trans isomerase